MQTVCAAVHEIGHAVLHDREKNRLSAAAGNTDKEPPKAKDENTMEVEALYPCFYNVDLLNYFP